MKRGLENHSVSEDKRYRVVTMANVSAYARLCRRPDHISVLPLQLLIIMLSFGTSLVDLGLVNKRMRQTMRNLWMVTDPWTVAKRLFFPTFDCKIRPCLVFTSDEIVRRFTPDPHSHWGQHGSICMIKGEKKNWDYNPSPDEIFKTSLTRLDLLKINVISREL
jgi:hypothetical protein